jgi:hypothetical protein
MTKQDKSSALIAVALLAFMALACSIGDETDKANKLVNEGNTAVQDGNKSLQEAQEKKEKMNAALHSIKSDADLAQARSVAKETIAALSKTADKWREAQKRFEEASNLKIGDKFKEYLVLKVKEFKLRAESIEIVKGTPQALIDSDSRETFISTEKANDEKFEKLVKEADDLAAQADKFQKENKDSIK